MANCQSFYEIVFILTSRSTSVHVWLTILLTMSNEVVLDIETQNTFDEVGGYFTDKLKVSLVGVYFYETDTYESFLEHELPQLFSRLERSGRIIGYNSIGFDMPVLNNYYAGDLLKLPQLDLLVEIQKTLGYCASHISTHWKNLGMKRWWSMTSNL